VPEELRLEDLLQPAARVVSTPLRTGCKARASLQGFLWDEWSGGGYWNLTEVLGYVFNV